MKMLLLYCIFRILLWLAGHFYSHNFVVPILCVLRRSDKDSWRNFLLLSAVQLIWQITKHLRNTGGGVTFEQNCFNLTVNRQGYYYFPWSGKKVFKTSNFQNTAMKNFFQKWGVFGLFLLTISTTTLLVISVSFLDQIVWNTDQLQVNLKLIGSFK